jgi:hypothetical protein
MIVQQNAMIEEIKEWFMPIILLNYHERYMANFISFWD